MDLPFPPGQQRRHQVILRSAKRKTSVYHAVEKCCPIYMYMQYVCVDVAILCKFQIFSAKYIVLKLATFRSSTVHACI